MSTPEVRLSPDGQNVAIRNSKYDHSPWRVTNGGMYADVHVSDWTPLLPVSNEDRVRCPWCEKPGRKLTKSGALRRHGKPVWPPRDCEGSGRKPSEFEGGSS